MSERSRRAARWLWVSLLWLGACTQDQPVGQVDTVVADDVGADLTDERNAEEDLPAPDLEAPDLPPDEDQGAPPEGCRADQCEIGGACVDNNAPDPANPCQRCVVLISTTRWSADDRGACDDGDPCTVGDACVGGACVAGAPLECDDDNPCTDDACVDGACAQAPNAASCDDGDPCTTGDACAEGACQPGAEPLGCDDENPCTADTCDPQGGCQHAPLDGGACDDGDACTVGDVCAAGQCSPGPARECDDQDLCTVDACDPATGQCVNADLSALCADGNPCTAERCEPARGCVFPFVEGSCDDGDACTTGDACVAGACRGEPVVVDVDELCAEVSCDPEEGVQVVFTANACDDNDACTVGDVCAEGGCVSGQTPLACDDGNACTDDACDPESGCTFTPNTSACDDGDACTIMDTCAQGRCQGRARGCDDGNACTADRCDVAQGCVNEPIVSRACQPQLEVIFPPRAATLRSDEAQITVRGTVSSGAGPIREVLINGRRANLRDGRFWLPISPQPGGNLLTIEARDALGGAERRVQSFLWSSQYSQPDAATFAGAIEEGMGLFLSRAVLDDADRSDPVNDLATVFDRVLDTYDIAALVPETAGSFLGFTVRIRGVTYGDPQVSLRPGAGELALQLVIPNLSAALLADGIFDIPGTFTSSALVVNAPIALSVQDNQLQVRLDPQRLEVSIRDPQFRFNSGIVDFLIGWLVDIFLPQLVAGLEDGLRDALISDLEPILANALGALALDTEIELPSPGEPGVVVPVRLRTRYQAVEIDPSGMALTFQAAASALTPQQEASNEGLMGRAGCLQGPQRIVIPGAGAFELVLPDDTLNALLYGAWRGGFLRFELPAELLGGVDLSQYNLDDLTLRATGLLQPTASDCNADGALRLMIGDLQIDASATFFGQPLDVVIYVTLEVGLSLEAGEGQIGLVVSEIHAADFEVNVQQEALLSVEPVIAQLLEENLLPALLGLLGGESLGAFPLPALDLSGALEGVDEPLLLTIDPQEITREDGNTIVNGALR